VVEFGQQRAVVDDHGSSIAAAVAPDAFNHSFGTLQAAAYEALAKRVPDVRWRKIVAFALARFIVMGTDEVWECSRELNRPRQNAQHAKILIDLLASSPYVGPRQKAKLAAASKLLAEVSRNLKVPAKNGPGFRGLRQGEAVQQFLQDLTEGFQATAGKWPTLADRSLSMPFIDLATNAVIAARDTASVLDPNLAGRLPPPATLRELLRSVLCKGQRQRNPL